MEGRKRCAVKTVNTITNACAPARVRVKITVRIRDRMRVRMRVRMSGRMRDMMWIRLIGRMRVRMRIRMRVRMRVRMSRLITWKEVISVLSYHKNESVNVLQGCDKNEVVSPCVMRDRARVMVRNTVKFQIYMHTSSPWILLTKAFCISSPDLICGI